MEVDFCDSEGSKDEAADDAGLAFASCRLRDEAEAMLSEDVVEVFDLKSDDRDEQAGEASFELATARRGGLSLAASSSCSSLCSTVSSSSSKSNSSFMFLPVHLRRSLVATIQSLVR